MKNYFVRFEVEEAVPEYEFIVKAKNQKEAEKLARKELKWSFPEAYGYRDNAFDCYPITADELLKKLTIN